MSLEDLQERLEAMDIDDVGQKRYQMFQMFEEVLERFYEVKEIDVELEERIEKLNGIDGYLYKLSQEFLTSSSTLEKKEKLEDMVKHVKRKE